MRIASLLPSATELVHFAGGTLVGVTHGCDYPPGVEELRGAKRACAGYHPKSTPRCS